MQRPVGSVGVEALPGGNCAAGFDNYCGVSRLRRVGICYRSRAGTRRKGLSLLVSNMRRHRKVGSGKPESTPAP